MDTTGTQKDNSSLDILESSLVGAAVQFESLAVQPFSWSGCLAVCTDNNDVLLYIAVTHFSSVYGVYILLYSASE